MYLFSMRHRVCCLAYPALLLLLCFEWFNTSTHNPTATVLSPKNQKSDKHRNTSKKTLAVSKRHDSSSPIDESESSSESYSDEVSADGGSEFPVVATVVTRNYI